MDFLVLIAVFVATVSLMVATYMYVNRRRLEAANDALARLATTEEERHAVSILKGAQAGAGLIGRLLTGRSYTESLAEELRRTGSSMSPATFVQVCIFTVVSGVTVGVAFGSPIFAAALGLFGVAAPFVWMKRRQRKRLEAFQGQLPDAIDMLVSAMKAGYSFQAAMNFIGEEMPAPLGPEFARFYDEQRLGIDVRSALLSLQARVDSMDLKMFVTAVLVQRESGGNLGEVLANISDIMRERFALEGELETLTAESRLSARILALLPLLVFVGMFVLNPGFMRPMLQQPAGQIMLVLAGLSVAMGYMVMVRIADIDV
ncbi:MAG TPA: type II secretion system F family protein [Gemmatimonadaceae bacterium]|nr:type II secretion system F family protein [Gemmatimonadaceae bacterium]